MAGKLMHALQYSRYGGGAAALKNVEVLIPVPKADEVLVKVEAASINPFDWKIQKGYVRPFLPRKFPCIPGTDLAGEVVKTGSSVTKFREGDKVVAMLSHASGGALAEYAVVQESFAVSRPAEVSAAEAAGVPLASLTAYHALQAADVKLGDGSSWPNTNDNKKKKKILVTAASGGVGHYAVQLAKLASNNHVTATCGARNIELVKSLGADEVLDYKTPEGAALTSPSGYKYDCVIHCTTGIPWSTFQPNLADNAKVIDLTPGPSAWLTFAINKITFSKKHIVPLILFPKPQDMDYVAFVLNLLKQAKVKTLIDSQFPLSKGNGAWTKLMEGHATGKVIIHP